MSVKLIEISKQDSRLWQALKRWSQHHQPDWVIEQASSWSGSLTSGAGYSLIKVDPLMSESLVENFPRRTPDVNLLKCFDVLLCEYGQLWPRLLWISAVKKAVARGYPQLDIRPWAYVAAEGSKLRLAVSLLNQLGFSKIKLFSENPEDLQAQSASAKTNSVGVDLEILPLGSLTLQPVSGSLLINLLDLNTYKDLGQDIAYFNFLKADGLVIDAFLEGEPSSLCLDAESARFKTISSELLIQSYLFEMLSWIKNNNLSTFPADFSYENLIVT